MKRTLSILLLLVFCFAFCSCSAKPRILLTGLSESGGLISVGGPEMDLQYDFREIGNKNRTHDITIDGKIYTGKYVNTCVSPFYKCDADVYEYRDEEGSSIRFWINNASDEPVLYTIGYPEDLSLLQDREPKSFDECYQLALDELGKRLNAEEYVLRLPADDEMPLNDERRRGVYEFIFVKMIGSAETNAIVAITVIEHFGIFNFSAKEAPSIDCSKDHSKVTEAMNDPNTQTLLNEKIGALYSECDPDKLSWTVINQTIVKLRSGKEGVQYDILVSSGNHESYISLLMLV